jgi:hypothetical protein
LKFGSRFDAGQQILVQLVNFGKFVKLVQPTPKFRPQIRCQGISGATAPTQEKMQFYVTEKVQHQTTADAWLA